MAWNQPGGNGNRDPWGNRGGQQGPPDLEEVLKKLQAGLGRLFGGGGGSGGGGRRSPGLPQFGFGKGLGLVLAAAIIGYRVWGFYIVDLPEQGVVLRFGKFVGLSEPGPHWIARPIYSVEKVNVEQVHKAEIGFRSAGGTSSSVAHESLMLTKDENIIDIKFAVLYRVREPDKYLFNVLDPDETLRQATETAVREVVGRSQMDYVLTEGRSEVAAEVETLIQSILEIYGAGFLVTSVNMQDAQPPREVQDAFDDAVKAREDEERFKNEARAYAADIIPKARGDGNAIREQTRAYKQRVIAAAEGETDRFMQVLEQYRKAPDVTRERLYIEAMESVIANSSKVLIDVEGGNNLMYLPIDKLVERETSTGLRRNPDEYRQAGEASGSSFGQEFSQGQEDLRGRARQ